MAIEFLRHCRAGRVVERRAESGAAFRSENDEICWQSLGETELGSAGEQPNEGNPSPSGKNIPLAPDGRPVGATFSHSNPGRFFLLGNALKNSF